MRKKIIAAIFLAAVLLPASLFAVSGITNIIITPPNPLPGTTATIQWDYTATGNGVDFFVMVSDSTTPKGAGSVGQWLVIGNGCATPPAPATDTCNPCCNSLGSPAAGVHTAGPYTFTVPSDLVPGNLYQFIIGMNEWFLEVQNWGVNPNPPQAVGVSAPAFTVPLPSPSASITKTAECSNPRQGKYILYKISYSYVNAANFTITDTIPPECSVISVSNSGVVAGNTVTWNTASVKGPTKSGFFWIIAGINAGVPDNTTIHNTAHWSMDEDLTGADSNDATVTTLPPIAYVKTQYSSAPGTAAFGENVTYTFDFRSGGMGIDSLSTFDSSSDLGNFTTTGSGAFNWVSDSVCDGCVFSTTQPGYPHLTKNTPANFCTGEITGDVWIGDTNNKDALIVFRDNRLLDPIDKAFGVGITSDGIPANMYVQERNLPECVPPTCYLATGGTIPVTSKTWFTIKIQVTDATAVPGGVRIRAKYWARGSAEPAAWAVDCVDPDPPPCGYVGFQGHPTNTNYYDNLKILTANPSNITAYDTVPSSITYVGGTAADTTHGAPVLSGGVVSWSIFSSLDEAAYSLTWWGTVSGCSDAFNTFSLGTAENPPVDSNTTTLSVVGGCFSPTITETSTETPTYTPTCTVTVTMTPVYYPTLVLTKICSTNLAKPGDTVNYTVNYVNNSAVMAASNVDIYDNLSTKLNFVSATAGGIHTGANPGGRIDWNIASIAPGASGSVSFSAVVSTNVAKGEQIANQAAAVCTPMAAPAVSNNHVLDLDIPALVLTPVVSVPNPAVDQAEIIFNLTVGADVTMKFYSISGELIRVMNADEVSGNLVHVAAGSRPRAGNNSMKWDLMNKGGKLVATGVYFYRVEAVSAAGEKASYISKLAVLR